MVELPLKRLEAWGQILVVVITILGYAVYAEHRITVLEGEVLAIGASQAAATAEIKQRLDRLERQADQVVKYAKKHH